MANHRRRHPGATRHVKNHRWWPEKPSPPAEEQVATGFHGGRRRQRCARPWVLECRFDLLDREWGAWGRYRTEEDRDRALRLFRRTKSVGGRIQYRPA